VAHWVVVSKERYRVSRWIDIDVGGQLLGDYF